MTTSSLRRKKNKEERV